MLVFPLVCSILAEKSKRQKDVIRRKNQNWKLALLSITSYLVDALKSTRVFFRVLSRDSNIIFQFIFLLDTLAFKRQVLSPPLHSVSRFGLLNCNSFFISQRHEFLSILFFSFSLHTTPLNNKVSTLPPSPCPALPRNKLLDSTLRANIMTVSSIYCSSTEAAWSRK